MTHDDECSLGTLEEFFEANNVPEADRERIRLATENILVEKFREMLRGELRGDPVVH